jgi:hypothetical protein
VSGSDELVRIAGQLRVDQEAVLAGLTLRGSNDQTDVKPRVFSRLVFTVRGPKVAGRAPGTTGRGPQAGAPQWQPTPP